MTREQFLWELNWLKEIYKFQWMWDCHEPSFNVIHIYENNLGEDEILSLKVLTESEQEQAINEIKDYYKGR